MPTSPRRILIDRVRRLRRTFGLELLLAAREITRRKRRSAVAVGAVAFGVVALLLASGFIEWILWAMREGTIRSGLGHIQITRPGYLNSGLADPLSFLLPDPRDAVERADTLADLDIETVAPRITFYGLISRGDVTLSFQAEGVRPEREGPLSKSVTMVAGAPLAPDGTRNEVLLGEGLAQNLGARVGDTVVVLVNTSHGGVNAVEASVAGVFSSVTKAYDDVSARLPLALAHRLLRVQGSTKWILTLGDTAHTERAAAALAAKLPAQEFEVTPWHKLSDFYNKTVLLFSRQIAVLKIIVIVIVLLAISNSMTIAVLERTGEIGTALALGATPGTIRRRFLVEGFVIGLSGAALGLLIGIAAAAAISAVGIPMPPPPGMARGYVGEILLTPALAAEATVLVILSAIAAAVLPAWRASRMNVVDAIRQGR
jgi:putative ABC transport system permease protein